jgi:hypothetical protein
MSMHRDFDMEKFELKRHNFWNRSIQSEGLDVFTLDKNSLSKRRIVLEEVSDRF